MLHAKLSGSPFFQTLIQLFTEYFGDNTYTFNQSGLWHLANSSSALTQAIGLNPERETARGLKIYHQPNGMPTSVRAAMEDPSIR